MLNETRMQRYEREERDRYIRAKFTPTYCLLECQLTSAACEVCPQKEFRNNYGEKARVAMKPPNSPNAKASVLLRYPHAVVEQEYWDRTSNKADVVIWDIPSSMAELQEDGVCRLRMLVGMGSDESEAWVDAWIALVQREGKAPDGGDN